MDLNTVAEFTWLWDDKFFLETENGNFIWSDPDYNGDNTIRPYNGTLIQYCKENGIDFGRGKGKHHIENYCGPNIKILR